MGKKLLLSLAVGILSLGVCYVAILVVAGVMAEKFPVKLPSKSMLTTSWTDWAYASGTWTIENEKSGAPFQTSEIFCSRQTKRCDFVTAPFSKAYFHSNLLCFLTLKRVPNTVRSSLIHSGSIVFKPSHKTLRQLHCDGHELDIDHVI